MCECLGERVCVYVCVCVKKKGFQATSPQLNPMDVKESLRESESEKRE